MVNKVVNIIQATCIFQFVSEDIANVHCIVQSTNLERFTNSWSDLQSHSRSLLLMLLY